MFWVPTIFKILLSPLVSHRILQNREYVLGFRVDPEEKLKNIYRTICALQKAYVTKPIFGVQHFRERPAWFIYFIIVFFCNYLILSSLYTYTNLTGKRHVFSNVMYYNVTGKRYVFSTLYENFQGTPQPIGDVMKLVDEDVELDSRPLRSDAYAVRFWFLSQWNRWNYFCHAKWICLNRYD